MVVSMSAKPLTVKEFEASVAEMWGSAVESTYRDLIKKAVLEERKACAKLCREIHNKQGAYEIGQALECAEAIEAQA
jgi:hypothetical protein